MSVVTVDIEIEAPIDEVFALAMDPRRTTEWVTIARDVKDVKGDPTSEGFEMKHQLCLRGVPFGVTGPLVEVGGPPFAR